VKFIINVYLRWVIVELSRCRTFAQPLLNFFQLRLCVHTVGSHENKQQRHAQMERKDRPLAGHVDRSDEEIAPQLLI